MPDFADRPPPPGAASASLAAEMRDGVKQYGSGETEVRALDTVSVAFERGEFTAIMGSSGSGKTTLLHCTAGLDTLTSGQTFIAGTETTNMPESELTKVRRDRLGFVFQAFNLVPTLTAKENMLLPFRLAGTTPDSDSFDQIVDTIGLRGRLDHRPSELSGGQQQRVAVGRALMTRPEIVFADEPTGNLDSVAGDEILDFLEQAVREFGQTVVLVTHDPNAAARADRALFLHDGRVIDDVADPTANSMLQHLSRLGS